MEEEHRSEGALRDTAPEPRYRGSNNMYRGVTISVKALTGAILAGLAALALAIVFLAGSGGFTVTFETDGGSQVPAQTCRYGELVRQRLITDVVRRRETRLTGADAYVCGPPPMVDAAIASLTKLGVKEEHIFYDKFTTTGEPEGED